MIYKYKVKNIVVNFVIVLLCLISLLWYLRWGLPYTSVRSSALDPIRLDKFYLEQIGTK